MDSKPLDFSNDEPLQEEVKPVPELINKEGDQPNQNNLDPNPLDVKNYKTAQVLNQDGNNPNMGVISLYDCYNGSIKCKRNYKEVGM